VDKCQTLHFIWL